MQQPDWMTMLRVFGRIGLLSFGGPAAQIALMQRELVDRRPWLGEQDYLRALSFCMLLPGPEAMQLATYAGWRLRGVAGGVLAGLCFVLPGALVVLGLAMAYARFGAVPLVQSLFLGVQAAVVVIVIEALLKLARRALQTRARKIIAILSFVGIFVFALPFPAIIALAAAFGAATARPTGAEHAGAAHAGAPPPAASAAPRRSTRGAVAVCALLWLVPLIALYLFAPPILTQIALFFSKLAVVTFGGAYAVLAYMTQTVVADMGWLSTQQMIDGLGLAETTPGPLILVTEFVGYLAGHGQGGPALGLMASAVTLWVTFVPCFLWVFTGAPYIDRLAQWARADAALRAVTAAVVGVILNLSVWFAAHVLFGDIAALRWGPIDMIAPRLASLDLRALVLTGLAALMLLWRHWPLLPVLTVMAALGALSDAI